MPQIGFQPFWIKLCMYSTESLITQFDYGNDLRATFSYDQIDRVSTIDIKDGVTYTINTINEVTGLSDGTSFTYDSNGNRTGKTKGTDTWVYTYDYANRLTMVEKNSATIGEYVYDGDGKRMQATEDSEPTTYIYAGLKTLYEETMTGTACYIYGPAGRLAKRTTINSESNIFYYHADHLGSTRLVTDSNKSIVTAVTYHPFGESYSVESSEDYLFTGKEKDSTGLYYYGARHYDPDLGRFLTRDPYSGNLVKPQSLNQYTYCYNNPLLFVDPDGRDPLHYEGPIYYGEEEKTLVYSHVPQLMGYVDCKEGYEWFAYFCIGEGIVWAIIGGVGIYSIVGPQAGAIIMKALRGVFGILKSVYGAWEGLSRIEKSVIISYLIEIAFWIVQTWKKMSDPSDVHNKPFYDDEGNLIALITIIDEKGGYERGKVTLFNGPSPDDDVEYEYRYYQGAYWILVGDEWVKVENGWKPGMPLPP